MAHPGELKKVDVYAFSLIAYYIVFGNKPWGVDKPDEMQTKVLKSRRPSFPEGADKEMKDLIQKCWDQDPQNRPTFKEIIDQMNSFS